MKFADSLPQTISKKAIPERKGQAMFKFLKAKQVSVNAPCEGAMISVERIQDPVFSQKMMGDGFGVEPETGEIYSPVKGVITFVFPTKHAITIKTSEGLDVLVHMGIDTVELNGEGFDVLVGEGQKVESKTLIARMDVAKIAEAGKTTTVIVVFPEYKGNELEVVEKAVAAGEPILTIEL